MDQLEKYVPRALVYALLWSMAGDGKLKVRQELGKFIRSVTTVTLPSDQLPIIDFEVCTQYLALSSPYSHLTFYVKILNLVMLF